MSETYKVNRLDYMILQTLYANERKDFYNSMTITEMIDDNSDEEGRCALGARMTIYKKLQNLVKHSFVGKGVIDNHADTYYIKDNGKKLFEDGGKNV